MRPEMSITNQFHDTIVAPSTPPGSSGLAVIRLSGERAIEIVDALFQPIRPVTTLFEMAGYQTVFGDLAGLDEVMVALFRAPHSFTGEDVVEISCHGGPAVKRAILETLIEAGCRLADPGEFSKRAFLKGKIDLVQAEAIMDLIGSESARQVGAAYAHLKGHLSTAYRHVADALYHQMAAVELILEFPEHEAHDEAIATLLGTIGATKEELSALAATYTRGRLVAEGARVVIYGEPNVGKSSMLNALVGRDRAIVTDIPGTTRDTIEYTTEIDGYKVTLIDTAGVRQTSDPIELEGVKRSEAALAEADIVVFLLDEDAFDERQWAEVKQVVDGAHERMQGVLVVLGKDDLRDDDSLTAPLTEQKGVRVLRYSAKRVSDQAKLAEAIGQLLEISESKAAAVMVTNARHKVALDLALESLEHAIVDIESGRTFDLVAIHLRQAADRLAELTGDDVAESLVDAIFSSFCVGK